MLQFQPEAQQKLHNQQLQLLFLLQHLQLLSFHQDLAMGESLIVLNLAESYFFLHQNQE